MQLNSTWSLVLTAIPALLVIASGVSKLTGSKPVMDSLGKIGMIRFQYHLGIGEIIFALLFIFPPTNAIGFVLLACYFSGALATDLSHKRPFMAPLIILGVLFLIQFVTNNNWFLL